MSEEIEVQEEAEVAPVEAVETEAVEEKVVEKEKPSGFIDFQELPEGVRDNVKMRVDSDFRKIKEQERKFAEYQKKLDDYEKKLAELNKPKEVAPPTPDDWYADPEKAQARQADYNNYVQSQAEYNAKQQLQEQQQQAVEAAKRQERLDSFVQRSESAGINQNELGYAANVAQSALDDSTQSFLMEHEYGPQILVHLAKNQMELQELASLNPYQVGVKLESIAKGFKPTKVTKAPPPDEPIVGTGVSNPDAYNGMLKGSTIR